MVVRYGRGNTVGVNILHNLTHTESLTLAGKDEQLFKYMSEKLLTRVRCEKQVGLKRDEYPKDGLAHPGSGAVYYLLMRNPHLPPSQLQ